MAPRRKIGPLERATNAAVRSAAHLTDADKGAIAALKYLARKIDTEDELRELALDAQVEDGDRSKPPPLDNVSVPTYLRYCVALGLTPGGRGRLPEKKPEGPRGTLSVLRDGAQQARSSAR